MMGESCVCLWSKEIWVFGSFRCIHNSLLSFWAKLGYSHIEIDHIAVSLLKLQIEIGGHFINDELSQLPTPAHAYCDLAHPYCDLAHAYSDLAHAYSDS